MGGLSSEGTERSDPSARTTEREARSEARDVDDNEWRDIVLLEAHSSSLAPPSRRARDVAACGTTSSRRGTGRTSAGTIGREGEAAWVWAPCGWPSPVAPWKGGAMEEARDSAGELAGVFDPLGDLIGDRSAMPSSLVGELQASSRRDKRYAPGDGVFVAAAEWC